MGFLQQIITGEILLVPELSFMTGIPERMKKDFKSMTVNNVFFLSSGLVTQVFFPFYLYFHVNVSFNFFLKFLWRFVQLNGNLTSG